MASRSHAVPILQLFALTVMIIPSDTVIKAVGAEGYPAGLVGMFAFAAFIVATVLGLHNPLQRHHPVRGLILLMWLSLLASYVLMDRRMLSIHQIASADRQIMEVAIISGVALVAAECLNSLREVRRVLRALVWGGAFCGVVAALQFWMTLDLSPFLRELPGFTRNFDNPGIISRAALNRAAGTSITPIELGVVAGMLLPLAIWLAIWDTERSPRRRWTPVMLIAVAIPASVSRSAILAIVVAIAVFVALMPAPQRVAALCAIPVAIAGVFMTAHGLIGTLTAFFTAGTADQSVATRVGDYPLVERLVEQAPWLGHGGGTYIADNMIDILDNQYLKTAIEFGLVGVVVMLAYFLVPAFAALIARRHSGDPELRLLLAALAGSAFAGAICSGTFDSLSFPMFTNVQALVIGLIGACWRLARAEAASAATAYAGSLVTPVNRILQPAGG
jgi:hypothetical protein